MTGERDGYGPEVVMCLNFSSWVFIRMLSERIGVVRQTVATRYSTRLAIEAAAPSWEPVIWMGWGDIHQKSKKDHPKPHNIVTGLGYICPSYFRRGLVPTIPHLT